MQYLIFTATAIHNQICTCVFLCASFFQPISTLVIYLGMRYYLLTSFKQLYKDCILDRNDDNPFRSNILYQCCTTSSWLCPFAQSELRASKSSTNTPAYFNGRTHFQFGHCGYAWHETCLWLFKTLYSLILWSDLCFVLLCMFLYRRAPRGRGEYSPALIFYQNFVPYSYLKCPILCPVLT